MRIFRRAGRQIKSAFSRGLPAVERFTSRVARANVNLSAPLVGAHIRDENDFMRHIDYIHINPVKHGLVTRVMDWPHSSFHRM